MPALPRLAWLTILLCCLSLAARGDDRQRIDGNTSRVLDQLRQDVAFAGELLDAAAGVLVFPDVVNLTFSEGGKYGEGSLQVGGAAADYYATGGTIEGLKRGTPYMAELILFMTEEALQSFRDRRSWEVGLHGNVAMIRVDANGALDPDSLQGPILGLIYSEAGLSYNLNLDGTRFVRIDR